MNTTRKTLSALALATTLTAATLASSSIASANGTGVIVPTQGNVHGAAGNVHGGPAGTGVIVPTQGNVHGVAGTTGVIVPTQGNVHGAGGNVHGPAAGTGVIVPTQGNVHGPAGTGVIEPSRPGQPGKVISCHPGTGCTLTPTQPPADKDHDHDHDYDHDQDRDHDRWHSSHREYRGWDFPVIEVTGYAPDSCIYVHKFRTIYVPGVGLERALVKVCEAPLAE